MDIQKEKQKLELARLEHALNELKYKKLERLEDIERIEDNMRIQQEAIDNKKKEIGG